MTFNKHTDLIGKHAYLGCSNYHWIRYDKNKIIDYVKAINAKNRGTEIHDFASRCIKLKQKLPRTKKTLNMFVNDCIGFRLESEQPLYYSSVCFGTTDAIGFDQNILRIFDYKSGVTPAHFEQLEIYAALFCLEYAVKPYDIKIELRIYQNDNVDILEPDPNVIIDIMNLIKEYSELTINYLKEE